jgi:hypothetical protein
MNPSPFLPVGENRPTARPPIDASGSEGLTGCIMMEARLSICAGGCGAPPIHCTRPATDDARFSVTTTPLTPFSPTAIGSLAQRGGSIWAGPPEAIVAPAGGCGAPLAPAKLNAAPDGPPPTTRTSHFSATLTFPWCQTRPDPRAPSQGRLDLSQLDPEPAYFHLVISSAYEFDISIRAKTRKIASPPACRTA